MTLLRVKKKTKKFSLGACPQTPLEDYPFAADLRNPSVCILNPRLELAQVLHEKWGHLMLRPSSFESRGLFR